MVTMALVLSNAFAILLPLASPRVRPTSRYAAELRSPSPCEKASPPPSLIDVTALALFRHQLQQESGFARPAEPGFDGMVNELRDYQLNHTVDEQIECSSRIMQALAGPVPFLFKLIWSPTAWAPAILAWFTQFLLPFLVGPMELTQRAPGDARAGGVRVERCAVLERSGCSGLCLNMCKRPTEKLFAEKWGVPLSMSPNFETLECQLSFGVEPLAVEDDPSLPQGCLNDCPLSQQVQHQRRVEPMGDRCGS